MYNENCKACTHPLDDKITELIIDGYSTTQVVAIINSMVREQELGDEFLIEEYDITSHKNNHLVPAKQAVVNKRIEEEGLKTFDSIKMLTETISLFDKKFLEIYNNLDFDIPVSFSRNINALKGLFKMKHDFIKLNAALLEDTADKTTIDLNKVSPEDMLALFDRAINQKKDAVKKKKEAGEVVI